MVSQKRLFITGCPRSGTTVLASLLNDHERVVIGIERYGSLFFRTALTDDLFARERFFDVRPGDTFYGDLDFAREYRTMPERFDRADYVGDKIPLLFDHLDRVAEASPGARILFCVRNIFDVAASYEKRAADPADTTWSRSQDHRAAVADWNRSFRQLAAFAGRLDIRVVDYDAFFLSIDPLAGLLDWLGLPMTPHLERSFAGNREWGRRLELARSRDLSQAAVTHICRTADFDAYRSAVA